MSGGAAASDSQARFPEPRSGRVARNAGNLFLGQAGTTFLAVLLSAALGRSLGAADFGLYFVLSSMALFALVVVEWGQGQAIMREVARRPEAAGTLLGAGLALRAGGVVAAAAVAFASAVLFLRCGRRDALLAAGMVLSLGPNFLAQTFGVTFRGCERMEYDAAVSISNKALTLALAAAALLTGHGLPGVIAAQAAAGLASLVIATRLGHRVGIRARRVTVAAAKELLAFGTPIVAMSLAIAAQTYIDAVLLARLAPQESVGWYGAARNILGTLIAPASILGTAAFPALSRAAHDPARLRVEIQAATRPLLLLAGAAGVGTYLYADLGISIVYGHARFGPAALVLKAFSPGFFLLFVDVLLGAVVVAVGRAGWLAVAKVVNIVAITGLELVLIPYFQRHLGNGGVGVVVAFGASELVMFAAAVLIIPRAALGRALFPDIGRAVLLATGTLAVGVALPSGAPILVGAAAALTFAALASALRLVTRSDVMLLASLVRRRATPRPAP